jgi:3-phenylpropionate/cinnamic acid dioxygenase small subunit
MGYLYETLPSLKMRMERVTKYDNAHSEDPASRSRRFVTNPRVHETASGEEYFIQANLLVTRNRGDANRFQLLSGTREDLVRRTPDGWRLSQRIVLLDQAVLEFANFGIFL